MIPIAKPLVGTAEVNAAKRERDSTRNGAKRAERGQCIWANAQPNEERRHGLDDPKVAVHYRLPD